jgi:AAA domain
MQPEQVRAAAAPYLKPVSAEPPQDDPPAPETYPESADGEPDLGMAVARAGRPGQFMSLDDACPTCGRAIGLHRYGANGEPDCPEPGQDGPTAKPDIAILPPLTLDDWRVRDLPEPDLLMGNWLSTTSRMLLAAATGLGKTNFGLALAFRVAAGRDFLHWRAGRPARVLYIDGEMSRRLLRQRLHDEEVRLGETPTGPAMLTPGEVMQLPPGDELVLVSSVPRLGEIQTARGLRTLPPNLLSMKWRATADEDGHLYEASPVKRFFARASPSCFPRGPCLHSWHDGPLLGRAFAVKPQRPPGVAPLGARA